MPYYKVVRNSELVDYNDVDQNSRVSAMAHRDPRTRVVYPIGEWAEARIGGLFVFDSMEEAINFFFSFGWEIWECECEDPIDLPNNAIVYFDGGDSFYEQVENFWSVNDPSKINYEDCPPSGTLLFRKVKLTKLMYTTGTI